MSQQQWIKMANLVFELDKKLSLQESPPGIKRTIERMKSVLEETGLLVLNPAGEKYTETRTDIEASITGPASGQLVITDVIKPIIYSNQEGQRSLLQRGVVIAAAM